MVELASILESEELKAAVRGVEALLVHSHLHRKDPAQKSFSQLALGKNFLAKDVLAIISGNAPSYPGLKEVLSAGAVGWALFPTEQAIRVNLMTQAVLWHMDDAERSVGLVNEPLSFGRDIVARYVFTGIDFLTEIYHVLGGYEGFTRTSSSEITGIFFDIHSKAINTTNRALAYLHHGADQFRDPEYDFAPSLNRAATIFSELKNALGLATYGKQYVARSLLHRRWSQTKPTLALIYSASTIKVHRNTLLQVMLDGDFHYTFHSKYLQEWLGRARYVSDHIFAKMDRPDLHRATSKLLADAEPRPFKAPTITQLEEKILKSQLRKRFRPSVNS